MLSSKLGICGALCSVLIAASACNHDNGQTSTLRTAYDPRPAATMTESPPPASPDTMSGRKPAPGVTNLQGPGVDTGLGQTTGSPMDDASDDCDVASDASPPSPLGGA